MGPSGSSPTRGTKGPALAGKNHMQSSPDIDQVATALAIAQGTIDNAIKNAQNPHLKNRYADLASVLEQARPALAASGLSIVTVPCGIDDSGQLFDSRVLHKSGQYLSTQFAIPLAKRDAQGLGSAITYARRYAYAAWLGIAQEDDDGNAASRREERHDRQPVQDYQPVVQPRTDAVDAINAAKTLAELETIASKVKATLPPNSNERKRAGQRYQERRAELAGEVAA